MDEQNIILKVEYFFERIVHNKNHSRLFREEILAQCISKMADDNELSVSDIYLAHLKQMIKKAVAFNVSKYPIFNSALHDTAIDDISSNIFKSLLEKYNHNKGANEKTFVDAIVGNEITDYIHLNFPIQELKPEAEIKLFIEAIESKNKTKILSIEKPIEGLFKAIKEYVTSLGENKFSDAVLNSAEVHKIIHLYFKDSQIKIPKYKSPKQAAFGDEVINISTTHTDMISASDINLLNLQIGLQNSKVNAFNSVLKYLCATGQLLTEAIEGKSVKKYLESKSELNVAKWDLIKEQMGHHAEIPVDNFKVKGFLRHYAIANSKHRKNMIEAIKVLRECRKQYLIEKKLQNASLFGKQNDPSLVPLLSSVLFDKDGIIVETAFKGETKDYNLHCEFDLFSKLNDLQVQQAIDGTLFVTLEPCNKRKYTIVNGVETPKIPCAVRCARSGIRNVFIATFDPHKAVKWEGVKILESGKFSFELRNGEIYEKDEKQAIASKLLKNLFEEWGCPSEINENGVLYYTISKPVKVHFFHPDLIFEAMFLNKDFIGKHFEDAFL